MADNKKNSEDLLKAMENFITTKSVVGEPIVIGETIILPMADVSFGMALGTFSKGDNGTGGVGGKITPSAVLVIQNGATKLVNIKNQDTVTKVLDMIPDIIDKFKGKDEKVVTDADIDAAIEDAAE